MADLSQFQLQPQMPMPQAPEKTNYQPSTTENVLSFLSPVWQNYYKNKRDLSEKSTAQYQMEQGRPTEIEASRMQRLISSDPFLQSSEATKDFAERPEFWLGQGKTPDMTNPIVAKTIEDFGRRQGAANLMTRTLENPTAASLAQFIQSNPEHSAAQLKQASGMIPADDTASPELRKAYGEVASAYADSPTVADFVKKTGGIISAFKGDPTKFLPEIEKLITRKQADVTSESKAEKLDEATLTQSALRGDKEAQAILDAMQKRKIETAKASRTVNQTGLPSGGSMGELNSVGVNPKALEGLDSGSQEIVKKYANYELPLPNTRNGKNIELLKRVSMYDPTFSASEYATRQALRKDYTSGKSSQTLNALNTATGHIDSLVNTFAALKNTDFSSANSVKNFAARYAPLTKGLVSRQGVLTAVKTKFNAVKGELATIFKNSGATDQEIKSWESTVKDPTTATPTEQKAFVDSTLELMGSRLKSKTSQYEVGMGKPKDFHFLNKKSLEILKKLGVDVNDLDPVAVSKYEGKSGSGNVVMRFDSKGNRIP